MHFKSTASNGTSIEKKQKKESEETSRKNDLTAVPETSDASVAHLLLQLEDTVHQGLGGRGAYYRVS